MYVKVIARQISNTFWDTVYVCLHLIYLYINILDFRLTNEITAGGTATDHQQNEHHKMAASSDLFSALSNKALENFY